MRASPSPLLPQSGAIVRYVAITGSDTVSCTNSTSPCRTIQYAVDMASEGDLIKVAQGVYTDLNTYGGLPQVVYISKTITIRGGYSTADWVTSTPLVHPTTLDAQGHGRVFFITGNISPTLEGLNITGGDASYLGGGSLSDVGGGLYVFSANVTISNSQIISNTSGDRLGFDADGGGLFLYYSTAQLLNNIIANNFARVRGGGLASYQSTVVLSNNIISDNTAGTTGGGLYIYESVGTFSGNTIINNTAHSTGGGIALARSSPVALISNTISANRTAGTWYYEGGGGLHVDQSPAIIRGNAIYSNTSALEGGGIFMLASDATLDSNDIFGNIAANNGGGLFLYYSVATLSNNTIFDNAASRGGGISLYWRCYTTLINNWVVDNQASTQGGGFYIIGASPYLLHNTIARNSSGDGSAIFVSDDGYGTYSSVVMTNTILAENGTGITTTAGNTARLNGVLFYSNTVEFGGTGNVDVTHALTGTPAFVNPYIGNYHIKADSAALNRGVFAGVTTDIDGDTRPDGCFPDIGADEFITGVNCKYVYLPVVLSNWESQWTRVVH